MNLELAKKSEVDKRDEVIFLAFSGRSDKQYSEQRRKKGNFLAQWLWRLQKVSIDALGDQPSHYLRKLMRSIFDLYHFSEHVLTYKQARFGCRDPKMSFLIKSLSAVVNHILEPWQKIVTLLIRWKTSFKKPTNRNWKWSIFRYGKFGFLILSYLNQKQEQLLEPSDLQGSNTQSKT